MSTKKSQNYDCKYTETTAASKHYGKPCNISETKQTLFQQLPKSNREKKLKDNDENYSINPKILNKYINNDSDSENFSNYKNYIKNDTLEKINNQSFSQKYTKENMNKNNKKLYSNNSIAETNISSNNNTNNNITYVEKIISKKQNAIPYCEHHKYCEKLPKKYTCYYKKCTCGYCIDNIKILETKNNCNLGKNKSKKITTITRHGSSVESLKNAKYKSILDIYKPKKPKSKENINITNSNVLINMNSEINENSSIVSNQLSNKISNNNSNNNSVDLNQINNNINEISSIYLKQNNNDNSNDEISNNELNNDLNNTSNDIIDNLSSEILEFSKPNNTQFKFSNIKKFNYNDSNSDFKFNNNEISENNINNVDSNDSCSGDNLEKEEYCNKNFQPPLYISGMQKRKFNIIFPDIIEIPKDCCFSDDEELEYLRKKVRNEDDEDKFKKQFSILYNKKINKSYSQFYSKDFVKKGKKKVKKIKPKQYIREIIED